MAIFESIQRAVKLVCIGESFVWFGSVNEFVFISSDYIKLSYH